MRQQGHAQATGASVMAAVGSFNLSDRGSASAIRRASSVRIGIAEPKERRDITGLIAMCKRNVGRSRNLCYYQ